MALEILRQNEDAASAYHDFSLIASDAIANLKRHRQDVTVYERDKIEDVIARLEQAIASMRVNADARRGQLRAVGEQPYVVGWKLND